MPGIHTGEYKGPVRVRIGGVNLAQLFDLLFLETRPGPRSRETQKRLGAEVAPTWHLNDAIYYPVNPITLPENLIMDEALPKILAYKVGSVGRSCHGIKHGPLPLKMVEVDSGTPRNDAIIVIGVSFCCFDAHAPAKRASDIVRVRRRMMVERLS